MNKTNKTIKASDFFKEIVKSCRENADYVQAEQILDYCNWPSYDDQLLPDFDDLPEVIAKVITGGCEGIYIDCFLVYDRKNPCTSSIRLGTYKTLDESEEAYGKMGLLSGLFIYHAEWYLNRNWRQFEKKED